MTRKLFSVVLSAFALLLLMGAAAVPEQSAALVAEEESAVLDETALETEADASADELEELLEDAVPAAPSENPLELAELGDPSLLIDGQPAAQDVGKTQSGGITYVALAPMAQTLNSAAQVSWDGSTAAITAPGLELTAQVGRQYLVANGRYLYLPEGSR